MSLGTALGLELGFNVGVPLGIADGTAVGWLLGEHGWHRGSTMPATTTGFDSSEQAESVNISATFEMEVLDAESMLLDQPHKFWSKAVALLNILSKSVTLATFQLLMS